MNGVGLRRKLQRAEGSLCALHRKREELLGSQWRGASILTFLGQKAMARRELSAGSQSQRAEARGSERAEGEAQ